jgi:hypothetical protein
VTAFPIAPVTVPVIPGLAGLAAEPVAPVAFDPEELAPVPAVVPPLAAAPGLGVFMLVGLLPGIEVPGICAPGVLVVGDAAPEFVMPGVVVPGGLAPEGEVCVVDWAKAAPAIAIADVRTRARTPEAAVRPAGQAG